MDLNIDDIRKIAEGLDLSQFRGDVVGVKIVENEIGNIEPGGIGVQKICGTEPAAPVASQSEPAATAPEQQRIAPDELFRFIHPAISDERELASIHSEVCRLVTHYPLTDVCDYLHTMCRQGRILLPVSVKRAYDELTRLGLCWDYKTFAKHYSNG